MKNIPLRLAYFSILSFLILPSFSKAQDSDEKPIWVRSGHNRLLSTSIAGMNDGAPTKNWKYFISTAGDNTIRFTDMKSGELVKIWEIGLAEFSTNPYKLADIATSPDERYLCTSALNIWSIDGDSIVKKLDHGGKFVVSPQFSRDNLLIAASIWSQDEQTSVLKIWNVSDTTIKAELQHSSAITRLAFMNTTNTIVFIDAKGVLYQWDPNMATPQQIGQTAIASTNHSFALSPNDMYILVSKPGSSSADVWDIALKTRKQVIKDVWSPIRMEFSPDSKYCAMEGKAKVVDIKDVEIKSIETGETFIKLSTRLQIPSPTHTYFSPDGKKLLIADKFNGVAEVMDIEKNEPEVRLLYHTYQVNHISVSQDRFITMEDYSDVRNGVLQIFENNGKKISLRVRYVRQKFDLYPMHFQPALLSPDKTLIAIITDTQPLKDNSRGIMLINAVNADLVRWYPAHQSDITKIMFSPDGKSLFTSSKDGSSSIWGVPTGLLKTHFALTSPVYSMALHGDTLMAFTKNGNFLEIVTTHLVTGQQTRMPLTGATVVEQFDNSSKIAISPNLSQIALAFHKEYVALWNTTTGAIDIMASIGQDLTVGSLAFSPDGDKLVIGGSNNMIQIWDTKATEIDKALIKVIAPDFPLNPDRSKPGTSRLPFYTSIVFSADGESIIAGTDDANLIKLSAPGTTSVKETGTKAFSLSATPNPAFAQSLITFTLVQEASVKLSIFDLEGREVVQLFTGIGSLGENKVTWNTETLPQGSYFIRLESGGKSSQLQCVIMR